MDRPNQPSATPPLPSPEAPDADVTGRLSAEELDALFDLDFHLKHVDTIFGRVFG